MSKFIEVKYINEGTQIVPKYATAQSAGCDVRANITEPITIKPLERKLIPTGLKIELPDGYECQVRPRSGLALKYGITVINTPGTIDADYRGEIGVVLINLSNEDFVVNPSDRIAQLVFTEYVQVNFVEADKLSETERGEGGYNHTGVK